MIYSYCGLYSGVSNMAMRFQGNDGGSTITALTLDMSAAGAATFNSTVTMPTVAYVGTSIVHDGDTDTSIDFDTNLIDVYAGGVLGVRVQPTAVTINETGGDVDFRVESDTNANALIVDAGLSHVGINRAANSVVALSINSTATNSSTYALEASNSSSETKFHVRSDGHSAFRKTGNALGFVHNTDGAITITPDAGGHFVFNEDSVDADFRVESDGNDHALFIDAGGNNVIFGYSSATTSSFHFNLDSADDKYAYFANNSGTTENPVMFINRQGSDGDLIHFRQENIFEGNISVSGNTVSYNGFAGRHESSGIETETEKGTVVSTIDELDVRPNQIMDEKTQTLVANPIAGQTRANHAKVKISDSVGDKRVYGVVDTFETSGKVNITSVGIGSIKVTGACVGGDLLESNGDGTAKVQSDDIIRSKTIGKVTIGNGDTGVKLVSCVMYCG
jgi:hypothetical protein